MTGKSKNKFYRILFAIFFAVFVFTHQTKEVYAQSFNFGSVMKNVAGCKQSSIGKQLKTLFNITQTVGNFAGVNTPSFGLNDEDNQIMQNLENIAPDDIYSKYDQVKSIISIWKKSGNLETESSKGDGQKNSVATYDSSANSKLGEVQDKVTKTQRDVQIQKYKENCLDGLASIASKTFLNKTTQGIIQWVNTGYGSNGTTDGNSFFLKNPESFFKDIAKQEILKFGSTINNPSTHPYGSNFMDSVNKNQQNDFAQKTKYTLDDILASKNPGKTSKDFKENFADGGWDGWLGMTQYPQNNPVGFNILAAQSLSSQLKDTSVAPATQIRQDLQQSGGFLNDIRCADPQGITMAQSEEALDAGNADGVCKKWETVTPGSIISEKITQASGSGMRQIEMADQINESLTSVVDSILNKFSSNLSSQGLGNMSNQSGGQVWTVDLGPANTSLASNDSPYPSYFLSPGSWLSMNLDFNLKTDLTQAFIDEQRTYVDKLEEYNKQLGYLIVNIRQLDYCIPGPNPNWEEEAREKLEVIKENIPSPSPIPGTSGSSTDLGALDMLGGTQQIQGMISTGYTLVTGDTPQERADMKFYAKYLNKAFMGDDANGNVAETLNATDNAKLRSAKEVSVILDNFFNTYKYLINYYYSLNDVYDPSGNLIVPALPLVTKEARTEFKKISSYQQIIENNEQEINVRKGMIKRLEILKDQIDQLNYNLSLDPNNTQLQNSYNASFEAGSPFINEFSILSLNFVDGDSIADTDSLAKQAFNKAKYVYRDLLKGPFGCEAELWTGWEHRLSQNPNPPIKGWQLVSTPRPIYREYVWYDYAFDWWANKIPQGAKLPNPRMQDYYSQEEILEKANNSSGPAYEADNRKGSFLNNIPYGTNGQYNRNNSFLDFIYVTDNATSPNIKCSDLGFDCVGMQAIIPNIPNIPGTGNSGGWFNNLVDQGTNIIVGVTNNVSNAITGNNVIGQSASTSPAKGRTNMGAFERLLGTIY